MKTIRTIGLVFLAVATLFGLIAMFTPTGEAAGTSAGTTITQTYSLWGLDEARTGATSSDTSTQWFDAAMDGTAGITYLRAAPAFLAIALVAAIIALVLTVAPATREGTSGGGVAIGAFVTGVVGLILHLAGLVLRVEGFLGSPEFLALRYATVLLALFLVGVFVALVLGLRPAEETHATSATDRRPAVTGTRRLMCPRCNTINEARIGVLPTCGKCGYSS